MVLGWNLVFVEVNGGVVHGLGFESLTFGGHWYGGVDRRSSVRILDFWGANGGVVHGRGFVDSNL
jgi:hypothetical protein